MRACGFKSRSSHHFCARRETPTGPCARRWFPSSAVCYGRSVSHRTPPNYERVLRELQTEFLALLPERVGELRSALTLITTDPAARTTMQRLGHRIGGTAATVHLDAVGALGRAIERYLMACDHIGESEARVLAGAVDALDAWVSGPQNAPLDLGDPRVVALLAREDVS